ncbi:hypothetical protein L3X38_012199 [Prunus dulcis]|uniref:Uncharacterized protein n=1 Tax=Prunus dulcis TaxID=3755 RepID=A0AAD4WL52_PRUDU|nr:hypothetical protein L3X38_012199 [Prunus dulcis]
MGNSDESSQSSVVETSNSFFIHSSDHPGLLLVNKRLNELKSSKAKHVESYHSHGAKRKSHGFGCEAIWLD